MTCRTIFVPTAAPRIGEHFDQFQFNKRRKTVTADNGLSHADMGSMSVKHKAPSEKAVPPWTNSDTRIQRVVTQMMWNMVHMTICGFPVEEYKADPLALAMKLQEALNKRCINFAVQRNPVVQDGILGQKKSKKFGYARLLTTVIYDRYRLGKPSNHIAAELKGLVSPTGVRQLLHRANTVARTIFDPEESLPFRKCATVGQAEVHYKRRRVQYKEVSHPKGKRVFLPTPLEFFEMSRSGRTASDLAEEYNTTPIFVQQRIMKGRKETFGIKTTRRSGCAVSIRDILALHEEGSSIEEIAESTGLTLAYIACVLENKFGVTLEDRPSATSAITPNS